MNTSAPFRIGTIAVHPASNEIDAGAGPQRLPPRIMALLLRLAREPGAPVDRTTLLDDVWDRRVVTDEVLSRAIADLRTALGDDSRAPRYVETLPKVGYRLVAAVAPLEVPAVDTLVAPAAVHPSAAAPPPVPAIPPPPPRAADATPAPAARVRPWLASVMLAAILAVAATLALREPRGTTVTLEQQLARATVLAGGDETEVAPRFSPDGLQVAYAAGGERSRIVVETLATRARRMLGAADELANSPVFTPDGRSVVYVRYRDDRCTLVQAPLDGAPPRDVADCPPALRSRIDLAPDGHTLVGSAQRRADLPWGLVTVDLATGATSWLTSPEPGAGDDVQPRYAPDGRRIAFFRGSDSRRELWLLDPAAPAAARRVGTRSGLTYGAAFMPRGDALLVATDWGGFRALEHVDLASGTSGVAGGRGARFPDVSRHGDIVFELATYRANVWRLDVEGRRAPEVRWPSPRYSSQLALSPDGTRVAFVSNRDGSEALYVAPLDGDAVRVPGGQGYRTIRPRWSDDGRWLYAVRTPSGGAGDVSRAVRIDPVSGTVVELEALGDRVQDVTPAGDGRTLVVGEIAGHATRLARSTLDGTHLERLPLPLVSEFRVAGGRIAFAQPQLVGLTACELATLRCHPLPVPIDDASRYDWTLAPDAVWRHVADDGRSVVEQVDVASGKVVRTVASPGAGAGVSLAAGRGGVPLLVAHEEPPQVDVMIAPR